MALERLRITLAKRVLRAVGAVDQPMFSRADEIVAQRISASRRSAIILTLPAIILSLRPSSVATTRTTEPAEGTEVATDLASRSVLKSTITNLPFCTKARSSVPLIVLPTVPKPSSRAEVVRIKSAKRDPPHPQPLSRAGVYGLMT